MSDDPLELISQLEAQERELIFSRFDNSVGDIRGTPRRRSLKRSLPVTSSRTMSSVHRSSSSSIALATGQNW